MKKFLSAILASAMILALAIPAFAATTKEEDSETKGATLTVESEIEAAALAITYDNTVGVKLNPYRVSVDNKTDSVIGVSGTVQNDTVGVPILGTIQVKGTTAGGISLDGNVIGSDVKEKKVFLFLDVWGAKPKTSDGEAYTEYTDFDGTAFQEADNRLKIGSGETKKEDQFYLGYANGDKTLTYKIKGNTATKCSTWNASEDKVTVEIVFSWNRTGNTIST